MFKNSFDYFKDNPKQKYIIFDFETCSLNLVYGQNVPWQLGMLVCQGNNIIQKVNKYIKWDNLKVGEGAARVTRFSMAEYERRAEPAVEVLDLFEKYAYDEEYLVLGHNILKFDTAIHQTFRKRLGRPVNLSYKNRIIDTHAIAKIIKLNLPFDENTNLLDIQLLAVNIIEKGIKTSLTTLGKENHIDFDYENLHDGLNDCLLNFCVWNKYIKPKMLYR